MLSRRLFLSLLTLLCAVLTLPVIALTSAWWSADRTSWDTLSHLVSTVLPDYALTSLTLAIFVGLGVAMVGSATAAAVTLFDFPGRRWLEWLLLLPLAMPAYVLAYAYTDTFQYSGPAQTYLRQWFGWQGALWPDIRSTWGAVILFILCLYPYVYLLVRGALSERGVHLMEAARLLGAPLHRRILTVAIPMARPAIAAGTALALMETLADYGVSSYFGLTTFTTGIYRAWLSMGDRTAAAQLSTVLLLVVAILIGMEQRAQQRMRYASTRTGASSAQDAQPIRLFGVARWFAWVLCGTPVLLGFFLPVFALLRLLIQQPVASGDSGGFDNPGLPWERFLEWSLNSFYLAALTAVLATGFALALAFAARRYRTPHLRLLHRLIALGYAVPGAVIVVGILLPAGSIQHIWPHSPIAAALTATIAGLIYAYLVRFTAVAMQSVESGYARLPLSYDESSQLLGHQNWSLWRRVHWPLLQRATWTAVLLVFVDVMKELPATLVLRPFNRDTLAVMANQLARDERLAEAALPSLAIVIVGLIPVLLLTRSTRSR